MGVGGREIGYPEGCPTPKQEHPMSEAFDPRKSTTASTRLARLCSFWNLSANRGGWPRACRACRVVRCATSRPGRRRRARGDRAVEGRGEKGRLRGRARGGGVRSGPRRFLDRAGPDGPWRRSPRPASRERSGRAPRPAPRRPTASTSTFSCAPCSAGSGANRGIARWRRFRAKRRRTCANQRDSARP